MATIEYGDKRLPERFWRRVRKSSNGCWHWTGNITARKYGQYAPGRGKSRLAHRYIYNELVEVVPGRGEAGYRDVDHECHNRSKSCPGGDDCMHRRCVNPAHLEAKTPRKNLAASPHVRAARQRTHCKRGHPLFGDNLYVSPGGERRACRACLRASNKRRNPPQGGRVYTVKTHCPQGHPYEGENLYVTPNGTRHCRACRAAALDRHKAKVKAL